MRECFADIEKGFVRTLIPIAPIFAYGNPIFRSEARRLTSLIAEFKEITLDFAGVEEVGRAFCHELFVVWQRNNPEVALKIINACEDSNAAFSHLRQLFCSAICRVLDFEDAFA